MANKCTIRPLPEEVSAENTYRKPLEFDLDDYLEDWSDWEGTEEELTEFLKMLWEISGTFARMGFRKDSTQLALGTIFKNLALDSSDKVKQKGNIKKNPVNDNDNEANHGR